VPLQLLERADFTKEKHSRIKTRSLEQNAHHENLLPQDHNTNQKLTLSLSSSIFSFPLNK